MSGHYPMPSPFSDGELVHFADRPHKTSNPSAAIYDLAVSLISARREIAELEKFVQDIAQHGLRADLAPTMDFSGGSFDMYQRMTAYLRRIDESLRESARKVLGEDVP